MEGRKEKRKGRGDRKGKKIERREGRMERKGKSREEGRKGGRRKGKEKDGKEGKKKLEPDGLCHSLSLLRNIAEGFCVSGNQVTKGYTLVSWKNID